ncbi:MAG: hypothetical protein AAF737_04160 [Pseudomonadota bacterium]
MNGAQSISALLACFPQSKATGAIKATFLELCEQNEDQDIVECCRQFRLGYVEGHNTAFMPSTAQFAEHLRLIARRRKHDAMQAARRLEAPRPEITAEQRARIAQIHQAMRRPKPTGDEVA